MRSYETMRSLLQGTGLYTLDGHTVVDAELQAYAAALDGLSARMKELLREGIVATATDQGLSIWETLMGEPDKSALTDLARRDMIRYRLSVMPWDFNTSGLLHALQSVGLHAEIEEFVEEDTIRITERSYTGLRRTYAMIESDCKRLLPAHLEYQFQIGSVTFDMLDDKDYPWDGWDVIDASWDTIEIAGADL